MKNNQKLAADELVQLANFRWALPGGGYCWVQGARIRTETVLPAKSFVPSSAEPCLVHCSSETKTTDAPVNEALFREFAETPRTQEGVLNFANTHGWLGLNEPLMSPAFPVNSESPKGKPVVLGERLGRWLGEIDAMYHLVRVWDPPIRGPSRVSHRAGRFDQRVLFSSEQIGYEWESDYRKEQMVIASRDTEAMALRSTAGREES